MYYGLGEAIGNLFKIAIPLAIVGFFAIIVGGVRLLIWLVQHVRFQ